MMIRNFFIILGMMLSTQLSGEIKKIDDLKEIKKFISTPSSNVEWIIFDIDYTLTVPSHPALQMPLIKQNKQRFKEEFAKYTKEEQQLIPALIALKEPRKLIDQKTSSLIKDLQNSGASVFGFTALNTSMGPEVGYIPSWRTKELQDLGLSFEESSPLPHKRIEFFQFPPFRGTYPLYQDGVLYSNVTPSKGEVLTAFLDVVEQKPTRIVFIDDSLENIESVEQAMAEKEILVIGLHYVQPQDGNTSISDEEWNDFWCEVPKRLEQYSLVPQIIPTKNVEAIQQAIETASQDCLVIFDMGNVILKTKDAILAINNHAWVKSWILKNAPHINDGSFRPFASIIDREAQMELVNLRLPLIIHESTLKNKTMILSKYWCGKSGEHTFHGQRIKTFHEFNINLGEPFPEIVGWEDHALQAAYEKGIILTEAKLKGPVLLAFLKQSSWQPKSIIFIDDRKEQCDSIAEAGITLGIPTLCIHYQEDQLPILDEVIADMQLKTLFYENYWISDEQIQQRLKNEEN